MKYFFRLSKHGLWSLISLALTVLVVLGVVIFYAELHLPDVDTLKEVHLQVPLRVYSAEGDLIAQFGTKRRIPVTLKQVPPQLIQAILATEDARFYEHPGVDFIGLLRASVILATTGRKVQGASTITMQVARNFFLSREKTFTRKFNEILLAIKIDQELSKEKILELYLNKIYFGQRAYGVAAAARVYYGKTLAELSLSELAMIAGLPKAPSSNNPIRNPVRALERRNHVLSRMLEEGYINQATYQQAISMPITARYHYEKIALSAPYVAEMVRKAMLDRYGPSAYTHGYSVFTTVSTHLQKAANATLLKGLIAYNQRHGYRGALENWGDYRIEQTSDWLNRLKKHPEKIGMHAAVVTQVEDKAVSALLSDGSVININWNGLSWARPYRKSRYPGRRPKKASDILKEGDLIRVVRSKVGATTYRLAQLPLVQGALVAMRPEDGAITALVGGSGFRQSAFNRATQALRQPGSNFKPFIYSAALAKGYSLASIINDAPIVMQDSGENQLWRPQNDNLKFNGPTRLRTGLTRSRNLVSIRLLQMMGVPYALNYVTRFGFDKSKLPNSLSLALGSGTVTPLAIARGFSVIANGGYLIQPYFIDRIVGPDNKEVYLADPVKACDVCIAQPDVSQEQQPMPLAQATVKSQVAYLMTQALRDVIQHGTGRGARVLKRRDIAGKTGTTNDKMDAWFSGFNSDIALTVWVGFDSMQTLYEYGSQAALPIWIDFMKVALKNTAPHTMPEPPGIERVKIDPETGLLAAPGQRHVIFEYFRRNNVPKQAVERVKESAVADVGEEARETEVAQEDEQHIF